MTAQELIAKWRPVLHATRHIWSWTEPEVLAYCAEIASQSRYMIECGSYLGRSAKMMLIANPALHLLCVDIFETAGVEHTFRHFMREEIQEGRCSVIVGNSKDARDYFKRSDGSDGNFALGAFSVIDSNERCDAVWVDDGHSVECVRRDIDSLLPLLKSGGILFGHDWDLDNDVAQGVKSMLPLEKLTFPLPRVWQYIKP
jgi:predicted O-methyltransferase YrrM